MSVKSRVTVPLGTTAMAGEVSGAQVGGQLVERGDERVAVLLGVRDGERPLLLAPRRHVDAAVHVVEPGELGQLAALVGFERLVVDARPRRERDAALGADAD